MSAHKLDFYASSMSTAAPPWLPEWPVVAAALAGSERTETEIFTEPQLAPFRRYWPAVTPSADRHAQCRADRARSGGAWLVIHRRRRCTMPPATCSGARRGVLLNKNLDFIDNLNAVVYPDGTLPLGSAGTATLFLGDVRVATNVRLFGDTRAIGTRVSAVVNNAVLKQGATWLDSAFVVSDWYVSAMRRWSIAGSSASACSTSAFSKPCSPRPAGTPSCRGRLLRAGMLLAGAYAVLGAPGVQAHRAHACDDDGHRTG